MFYEVGASCALLYISQRVLLGGEPELVLLVSLKPQYWPPDVISPGDAVLQNTTISRDL